MKKVWHYSVRVGLLVTVVLALTLVFVMSASTQEPDEEAESRTQPAEIGSANLSDPPPEGFQTLYIFTGLTNDNTGSDMIATVLHCTNIAPSQTAVEVQLFDVTSTDVYTSRVTMSSGRTWTWATQNPPIYVVDTLMSSELIQSGSGRIVADTRDVICVAQVVDPVNTVPTFLTDLPLIDVRTQAVFLPSISKE
jgi:hypothetical protein